MPVPKALGRFPRRQGYLLIRPRWSFNCKFFNLFAAMDMLAIVKIDSQ
jgi:hypothetical protein